ncbi:MAG: formate dehydrogenase, partial [Rhodospirillaceae bacterium]|nr:formate dehydrogenase [Rhodospirillaceae bacterium]
KAGLTVVEIMDAVYKNEIRFMYIMGENPAMSDPDTAHARKALSKLNHLVVQDIFLTETAAFADVIFPASAWPEKDGSVTNTDRRVQLGSKVINSPGDARPDWLIIRDLANLLGLNWAYDSPQDIHNEMTKCMPSMENIPWKRLEEEGSVTYPTVDKKTPGQEIIFSDGFPTKTGKGKLVPVSITPPDEKLDKNYPLVLTTGRLLEHWHTGAMTRRAAKLNALEPHLTIHLSPIDIQRLDLELGEIVEVSTKRGRVKLAVREEPFMPEGLIFLPFCYFEAAANILTNPALDPVAKIPELKYAAAQLTKIVS